MTDTDHYTQRAGKASVSLPHYSPFVGEEKTSGGVGVGGGGGAKPELQIDETHGLLAFLVSDDDSKLQIIYI